MERTELVHVHIPAHSLRTTKKLRRSFSPHTPLSIRFHCSLFSIRSCFLSSSVLVCSYFAIATVASAHRQYLNCPRSPIVFTPRSLNRSTAASVSPSNADTGAATISFRLLFSYSLSTALSTFITEPSGRPPSVSVSAKVTSARERRKYLYVARSVTVSTLRTSRTRFATGPTPCRTDALSVERTVNDLPSSAFINASEQLRV
mmetsp:Transcript_28934/g.53730  ORF Transcript_28934/g.53730 Transcript_28934/m.53730 type:complete len:203 (+) Transcript_28934:334-942(+)